MAELRAAYEAVWGVHLDGVNLRRSVVTEEDWAIGGKAAELYRAGRMWKYGSPIRRSQPNEKGKGNQ